MSTSVTFASPAHRCPEAEVEFIDLVRRSSDPKAPLAAYAGAYRYFSSYQVIAFARVFQSVSVDDHAALSVLADVLHEELGRSEPSRVHSVLFERFASAVRAPDHRVDPSVVPLGVRHYVRELERGFGQSDQRVVMATYKFLEDSAVESYAPMAALLADVGFDAETTEFFALHSVVEIEHAAVAQSLLDRAVADRPDGAEQVVAGQTTLLQSAWSRFWSDILEVASTGVADRQEARPT